ncbi:hypothetical protein OJ253_3414 [Cryptosporidium canis]|uniref:Uncharacterized protein n=1 Tax=Cryptosporidium canis TaxID=195482 RepID=A0A9D5DE11_9CRYT|nr:hypothetical protein OJ253_3414 [Cryptosporidium canis]
MNGAPSLVTICVNKLRTIRNSITSLKERDISKDLIYLIFKGSTCHELLVAERNNVGIEKMFGSDDGQIWDSLWETAVKIRFSHSEQTLSKKESSETYREFFIRSQEDAERKFKSHILKRSNSMGGSKQPLEEKHQCSGEHSPLQLPKHTAQTKELQDDDFGQKAKQAQQQSHSEGVL